MFIKLDDIELIKKKDDNGDVGEIRSVHDVRISGRRHVVELRIPGAKHNIFQDMGREPITIAFDGRIVGKDAEGTVDLLEEKFEKNEALPFETDMASLKSVSEVVIAGIDIRFIGGIANAIDYSITLREHKPESKGGEGKGGEKAPSQKGGKEDAQKKMKEAREDSAKSSEGGAGSSKESSSSYEGAPPPPPPPEEKGAQSSNKEPHARTESASGREDQAGHEGSGEE